jgi:hypothetical protein
MCVSFVFVWPTLRDIFATFVYAQRQIVKYKKESDRAEVEVKSTHDTLLQLEAQLDKASLYITKLRQLYNIIYTIYGYITCIEYYTTLSYYRYIAWHNDHIAQSNKQEQHHQHHQQQPQHPTCSYHTYLWIWHHCVWPNPPSIQVCR